MPESSVAKLDSALQTIAYQKCTARVGAIGSFAKQERIAIMYVEIVSPSLTVLAQLIQEAVRPLDRKK